MFSPMRSQRHVRFNLPHTTPSSHPLNPTHIPPPRQQPSDRDILVQPFPMDAESDPAPARPCRPASTGETSPRAPRSPARPTPRPTSRPGRTAQFQPKHPRQARSIPSRVSSTTPRHPPRIEAGTPIRVRPWRRCSGNRKGSRGSVEMARATGSRS